MGVPLYGFIVIIKPSGGDGKVYPLTETRVTIGRQDTCNIRIPNLKVSKEHCAIRVVGRKVTLTNLSSNKTIVGGQFLALGQQRVLRYGDIITIAGRSLRYEKPTMSYTETATPPGTRIDIGSLPQTPQTEPVPRQHRRADGPENTSPTTPTVRAKPMPLSEGRTQQRARLVRCALRAADIKAKIDRWNLFYSESDDLPRKPSGPRNRQGADAVGSEADLTEESPPADLFDDLGEGTSRKRSVPSTPHDDGDGDERRANEAAQVIKGSNVGSRRPQLTTPVSSRKRARLLEDDTAQSEGKESVVCPLQRRSSVPQFMDGLENSGGPGVDMHPVLLSQPQELITPAQSSSSASTLPMKPTAMAYGSEDKTSRVTIGVNAESAFTKSPTLQRKRMTMQLRSQRKEQEKDKALDPVDAATKLVSVSGEKQQPQAEMHRRSAMPSMTSPLKRTLSSGGPFAAARRLCPESLSYLPPCTGPMAVSNGQATEGDSSDEVPTEPEPESESEDEKPAPVAASNGQASQGLLTRKRRHLTDDEGTPPRKSVRFGPPLSPELFDTHEPPATPLRRGTPMQMAPGVASILRQTPEFVQISTPHPGVFGSHVLLRGSPGANTGNTSLIAASPNSSLSTQPDSAGIDSLLAPRLSRRRITHQYLSAIASVTEESPASSTVSSSDLAADAPAASPSMTTSPATLNSRQRRRRSLRASERRRRSTMDSDVLAKNVLTADESPPASPLPASPLAVSPLPGSPRHMLRASVAVAPSPLGASASGPLGSPVRRIRKLRKDRRVTIPSSPEEAKEESYSLEDIDASIAAMAAALGEDVPQFFNKKPAKKEPQVEEKPMEEIDDGVNPVPLPKSSIAQAITPALGLAEAVQLGVEKVKQIQGSVLNGIDEDREDDEDSEKALDELDKNWDAVTPPRKGVDRPAPRDRGSRSSTSEAVDPSAKRPRRDPRKRLSASEVLLREQAELQARISATNMDNMSDLAADTGANPTATPEKPDATPKKSNAAFSRLDFDTPVHERRRFRSLGLNFGGKPNEAPAPDPEAEVLDISNTSIEEIISRRDRIHRLQDRRRRRQTAASLRRRRSSWQGWVPASPTPPAQAATNVGGYALRKRQVPPARPKKAAP